MQFVIIGVDEREGEEHLRESKENVGSGTIAAASSQFSYHYNIKNSLSPSRKENIEKE